MGSILSSAKVPTNSINTDGFSSASVTLLARVNIPQLRTHFPVFACWVWLYPCLSVRSHTDYFSIQVSPSLLIFGMLCQHPVKSSSLTSQLVKCSVLSTQGWKVCNSHPPPSNPPQQFAPTKPSSQAYPTPLLTPPLSHPICWWSVPYYQPRSGRYVTPSSPDGPIDTPSHSAPSSWWSQYPLLCQYPDMVFSTPNSFELSEEIAENLTEGTHSVFNRVTCSNAQMHIYIFTHHVLITLESESWKRLSKWLDWVI